MSGSESFQEVQPGRALWPGETSSSFTSEVCRRCHGRELLLTEPAEHDDIGIGPVLSSTSPEVESTGPR